MSQFSQNYESPQNSQQQQQQQQQHQQQQQQQQHQQQTPYPPSQHYYYTENHHQYPPAVNNGSYQQYPGISASPNQPHQHEQREPSLQYQQNMQQHGASQHSPHPYNGGYGAPQLPPRPYPPQHQFNYAHHSQQPFTSPDIRSPETESEVEWKPTEKEIVQLDQWFSHLDAEGRGYIGGAQAAGFLSNSNLSRDTLRAIWGLVDSRNAGYIDRKQFYRTIRLVSISCSPEFAGMAPSLQKYYSTAALSIPLPDMAKNTPASTAEVATADKMAVTAGAGAGGNSPGMAQPAWQSNQSVQQGTPSSADKMAVTAGAGAGGNSPGMAQPAWQSNQSVQQGAAFQNVYAAPQASIDSNLNHLSEKQSAGLAIPAQVDSADVDDFEFSDFESAAVDPAQSINLNAGPSTVSLSSQSKDDATVSENVTGQVTHTQTSDLDFDFDDFSAPSNPPAVVSERDSHSHAGPIVASATSDAPIIAAAVVTPAVPVKASVISGVGASPNINMSFFDDLIEGDKQQQEEAEEWEEFAGGKEEDTSKTVEEDGTVNPFEAFNSGEADKKSSSPPAPIQLENTNRQSPPTVALMNLEPHARSLPSLAFDDFGYPAEIASKPSTTIVNDDVAVTPITFPAFEDEDFGDFEEAEAAQPVIPKVELPMFSANFSIKPPAPSSSNRDSRFDTMDLLSMDDDPPLPMPSLPLFSGFQENFAASNLAATSSISTLLKVGQQNSSSGDTSAEAFSPSPSPAPSPAVTHLLDLDTVSFNPTERSSKAAPLTISTLEQLAVSLTSRDYYEEAYCCLQKASLLKTTDRLNEDKMVAIDADDLEAAVTIKKKLVTLKASLAALGDESRWTAAAASKRPGESLADLVDLVCAIDPSKRDWAQQLLLLIPPMSSKRVQGQVQDIEDLVAKALSVKRSLRMAIAVSTTHTKHSQYWLLLLNHVSSAVQNTSNIMDAYNRLSGADKESVLACERMKIFIAGSLKIAELGVWVSASCVECVVHEAVAERVVVQCHVFVRAAAAMWKGATKDELHDYTLPTVAFLSRIAAEQAALSTDAANVVYCYLTLRPIATGRKGTDALEPVIGAVRDQHKSSGEYFLKTALSIWTQEISTDLPESDGSF